MINILDIEDYLYKVLESYENDSADSDYQVGHKNAHQELLNFIESKRRRVKEKS